MRRGPVYTLITLLLGIFMGALDTGIISPALTTIVNSLKVDTRWAVWTLTLYSLVYAVSMPLIGKLSDRYGRKRLYIFGVSLFGIGSLICGLSGNLPMLLIGRFLQAVGGGGIFPVATAEVAEAFPVEKRGMALGFLGASFGVANIVAPNIGGFILDHWNWHGIFLVNIPIVIITIILALGMKESEPKQLKPLDIKGTLSLSLLILAFMYALTNLRSEDFLASAGEYKVWAFLLACVPLAVFFILSERKAEDPAIRLEYFRNKEITLGLIISAFTGFALTSMFFLPSFVQTVVDLSSGQSGYVVTPLVLASGILAPVCGIITDKIGAKRVLLTGFLVMGIGTTLFTFWVDSLFTLIIAELFIGAGIAFTMGTPVNYLILSQVKQEEAGSATGILSLFRSIGIAVGPTILVGFLGTSTLGNKIGAVMKDIFSSYAASHPEFAAIGANFSSQMAQSGSITSLDDFEKFQSMLPPDLYNELYIKSQHVVQTVMQEGYKNLYLVATVGLALGFLITLGLKRSHGKSAESK